MSMVPPSAPERAMVFIDLMNLYKSLESLRVDTNVDYHRLALKLAEPHRRLIRCYVYTGSYDQSSGPVNTSREGWTPSSPRTWCPWRS
jgi:hypothetical protein